MRKTPNSLAEYWRLRIPELKGLSAVMMKKWMICRVMAIMVEARGELMFRWITAARSSLLTMKIIRKSCAGRDSVLMFWKMGENLCKISGDGSVFLFIKIINVIIAVNPNIIRIATMDAIFETVALLFSPILLLARLSMARTMTIR